MRAVLYVRVSGWEQDRTKNLRDQERRMVRRLGKMGVKVVGIFREVGSGKTANLGFDSTRRAAALCAKAENAIVIAESVSRLLRNNDYSKTEQRVRPGSREWEQLTFWTGDAVLATLERPDIRPSEERSMQTKRGLEEKDVKPGRPPKPYPGYKKQRRADDVPRVLALRAGGYSLREISRMVGVAVSTLRPWLKA